MAEKLGLTFGTLIAHFIPGFVLLLSGSIALFNILDKLQHIQDHSTILIAIGSVISLALGLTLDACRYLITQLPTLISQKYRKWCTYDISKANEDERKYHDWIIEHYYRFHQFYGNLSLALLFSAIILTAKLTMIYLSFLYGIFLICGFSSGLTYYRTMIYLKEKFPK